MRGSPRFWFCFVGSGVEVGVGAGLANTRRMSEVGSVGSFLLWPTTQSDP